MLLHAFGTVGLVLVLVAYWLNSSGRVSARVTSYQLMNLVGALILVAYSVSLTAWASVGLNVIWALIALNSLRQLLPGLIRQWQGSRLEGGVR